MRVKRYRHFKGYNVRCKFCGVGKPKKEFKHSQFRVCDDCFVERGFIDFGKKNKLLDKVNRIRNDESITNQERNKLINKINKELKDYEKKIKPTIKKQRPKRMTEQEKRKILIELEKESIKKTTIKQKIIKELTKEPLTITQIARLLKKSTTNISRDVKELRVKGLIKIINPTDKKDRILKIINKQEKQKSINNKCELCNQELNKNTKYHNKCREQYTKVILTQFNNTKHNLIRIYSKKIGTVTLQKQLNRVVNGKEYHKYVIIIPNRAIKQLRWTKGTELTATINRGLIIKKRNKT